ncbi:MAG: bifunctional heptose 7-phosphate kinase/heptose 1-phosphate adenyltransferase [Phycisphaerae bacterium]|nr:bifunctional heptose 7-phosphate kinase/heptose 1-phosphate adenyltransferase [Phycisphaerae bacterium]
MDHDSPVSHTRLLELLDAADKARVAVVGDFMLDQYLYGDAERISPEAPVPVLRIVRRESGLGGAASVAADIAALGADALCFGIVGDDAPGRTLRARLSGFDAVSSAAGESASKGHAAKSGRIDVTGLLTAAERPTTVKTRLVGLAQHRHRQQLLRMDEEDATPLDGDAESRLLQAIESSLGRCGIVCIQDYGKGVVTRSLCRRVIDAAAAGGLRVLIDPMKARDAAHYTGAWICTPNRAETEQIAGLSLPDIDAVHAGRAAILAACRTQHVCVTLDAEGCALIGPGDQFEHLPTRKRDVYDVTGAGDAVLATLGIGLAAGGDLREAAALANIAGGLEVEKFGCVPVTRDEMIAEILLEHSARAGKLRSLHELTAELARRRARGETIVFTNGCFDLLHRGHVEYLACCRAQGDVVVVGLNSDDSVRRQNKGPDRPIHSQEDRAAVLAALASVDYVIIFDDDTPAALIDTLKPDVLVKGADWEGKPIAGADAVTARGGRVVLAPLLPGRGTSTTLERIRRAASPARP